MKDIEGYEGLYSVTENGEVFSYRLGKMLSISKNPKRYPRVSLTKDGVSKGYNVHRLVAKTFIPNPDNKPCVNHIDGVKTNNKATNLEWCTYKENISHAVANGLHRAVSGEQHPSTKITHCPQGHQYTAENTLTRGEGWRSCKKCQREATRRWKRKYPERVNAARRRKQKIKQWSQGAI